MPENPPIVVGVAGRIGSGKTAIARRIESEFEFQYLRYSQVLAEWFHADPTDKVRLQEVGGDVMAGDGQRELNRRLIGYIEPLRDVVVDGLRHPTDYESLLAEFGDRFFLIFVETPLTARFERLRDRYSTLKQFCEADSRSVESHIDSLQSVASIVLTGTMPSEQLTVSLHNIMLVFRERMVA